MAPTHVLDDYYLGITALVTVAFQLVCFFVAFYFQFDKITGKATVLSASIRPSIATNSSIQNRPRRWHQLCCPRRPHTLPQWRAPALAPACRVPLHDSLVAAPIRIPLLPHSQDGQG